MFWHNNKVKIILESRLILESRPPDLIPGLDSTQASTSGPAQGQNLTEVYSDIFSGSEELQTAREPGEPDCIIYEGPGILYY